MDAAVDTQRQCGHCMAAECFGECRLSKAFERASKVISGQGFGRKPSPIRLRVERFEL